MIRPAHIGIRARLHAFVLVALQLVMVALAVPHLHATHVHEQELWNVEHDHAAHCSPTPCSLCVIRANTIAEAPADATISVPLCDCGELRIETTTPVADASRTLPPARAP
jgi:hypothetical protein